MATKTTKTPAKKTTTRKRRTTTTAKAKTTAKKTVEKTNVDKILETAKSVNQQVVDTTKEVLTDVMDKGVKLTDNISDKISDGVKFEGINIKKVASDINTFALETTGEFADAAFETAGKWQNLAEKTVKDGLKLTSKQQTLVFDTLDEIKVQLNEGIERFSKLFSKN